MPERVVHLLWLVRFFRIVPPVPRLLIAAIAGTTTVAGAAIAIHPERAAMAFTPVLLLQLFAASSGFMLPARRGHYDLLITMGHRRLLVAGGHWLLSVLPGVVSWLLLAAMEAAAGNGAGARLFASGTVAALALVSTLPWALNVALPRFAAAIGWLVALAGAATLLAPVSGPGMFTTIGAGTSWLEAAFALLLYPPLLVGHRVAGPQFFLAGPALLTATAAMAYAFVYVNREDIPLEAAQ